LYHPASSWSSHSRIGTNIPSIDIKKPSLEDRLHEAFIYFLNQHLKLKKSKIIIDVDNDVLYGLAKS
jgi:hypothetical protein